MDCQIGVLLILAGLIGIDSITTVSKVSVTTGGSISIPCLYAVEYRYNVKYLCKGYYWNSCSYAAKTNQVNSWRFSISDDEQRIFTVVINDLGATDTDYWCAVEIKNGADAGKYFHLAVTSGTPSLYVDDQNCKAFKGESITIKCLHSNSGHNMWCRLGGPCVSKSSGSIDGTSVTINGSKDFFTVTMSELKLENSGWYLCVRGDVQMPVHLSVTEDHVTTPERTTVPDVPQSRPDQQKVIITVSVLIPLVIVTLFICFLFKRYEKRPESTSAAPEEGEVAYSVVSYARKKSNKVEAKDEDVVYSDLSQKKQEP